MQAIRTGNYLERLARIRDQQQQDSAQRMAKYGFGPDCQCSWCGDTGINREQGSICHCEAGEKEARRIARAASWPHLVPTHFERFTLVSCPNTQLARAVATWLAGTPTDTGQNLVIQGPVGVGKTGVAIAALRELHMAGKTVAYWSLPSLMDIFREEERGKAKGAPVMPTITRVDCLLLDDIGGERVTDYVAERMFVLVDGRYGAHKPTILTTNLAGRDLADHIGARCASRLRENYLAVQGAGKDLRDRTGNES